MVHAVDRQGFASTAAYGHVPYWNTNLSSLRDDEGSDQTGLMSTLSSTAAAVQGTAPSSLSAAIVTTGTVLSS